MGNQQLLLIVLGVVVVGIAVTVGVSLFHVMAVISNKQTIVHDLPWHE